MADRRLIVDRFAHEVGSEWRGEARPCENCEKGHNALVRWSDRTTLCFTCSTIRRRNLRIAGEITDKERGSDG